MQTYYFYYDPKETKKILNERSTPKSINYFKTKIHATIVQKLPFFLIFFLRNVMNQSIWKWSNFVA